MELRNLTTFLRAAELGSFARTAELLECSPATVTVQIQQLEAELEVRLFDRVNKTVKLTQQGQKFLPYARQVLHEADEAKNAMSAAPEESGVLRIGLADSLCSTRFPDILQQYHRLYPQVHLELRSMVTDEMFRMLEHNETDLVYTLDNRIFRSSLVKVLDVEEPLCFVSAANHPLARQKGLHLADLLKEPFILTEPGMSYRAQLDQLLASRLLELQPFLSLGNTELIRRFVENGMGLSFLPLYTVQDGIKQGTLARLDVVDCPIKMWRQLMHHKNKWVTPQMDAMFRLIRQLEENPEQ